MEVYDLLTQLTGWKLFTGDIEPISSTRRQGPSGQPFQRADTAGWFAKPGRGEGGRGCPVRLTSLHWYRPWLPGPGTVGERAAIRSLILGGGLICYFLVVIPIAVTPSGWSIQETWNVWCGAGSVICRYEVQFNFIYILYIYLYTYNLGIWLTSYFGYRSVDYDNTYISYRRAAWCTGAV
jgi:hypothetical protein